MNDGEIVLISAICGVLALIQIALILIASKMYKAIKRIREKEKASRCPYYIDKEDSHGKRP